MTIFLKSKLNHRVVIDIQILVEENINKFNPKAIIKECENLLHYEIKVGQSMWDDNKNLIMVLHKVIKVLKILKFCPNILGDIDLFYYRLFNLFKNE